MAFSLRQANRSDADAIAGILTRSFSLLTFVPKLHTAAEDRIFIAAEILPHCAVTVAEDTDGLAAFLARQDEGIRLLYVHPDRIGQGAGSLLIAHAKASGVAALELWCFQDNRRARRFYERHGFRAIRFTDGAANEEKTPDMRYRWAR